MRLKAPEKATIAAAVCCVAVLACGAGSSSRSEPGNACATPPTVASAFAPVFPDLAHRARIAGFVTVEVGISAEGEVIAAEASPGLKVNPLFVDAAVGAAKRWRFNPAANCASRRALLSFTFKHPGAAVHAGVVFVPPYAVEVGIEAITVDASSTEKS